MAGILCYCFPKERTLSTLPAWDFPQRNVPRFAGKEGSSRTIVDQRPLVPVLTAQRLGAAGTLAWVNPGGRESEVPAGRCSEGKGWVTMWGPFRKWKEGRKGRKVVWKKNSHLIIILFVLIVQSKLFEHFFYFKISQHFQYSNLELHILSA